MRQLLCCLFFFSVQMVNAQSPTILSEKFFGGSGSDVGQFVFPTNDGNYILIGSTSSGDGQVIGYHGGTDIWVTKISVTGTIQWSLCLGGSNDDVATSYTYNNTNGSTTILATTNSTDGNVVGSRGMTDVLVVQLSASGTVNWQRTMGGTDIDKSHQIIETTDGSYLYLATTRSNSGDVFGNHGLSDLWLVKLSNGGTTIWSKAFGGTADDDILDSGGSLLEPVSNTYVFSGNTASNNGDVTGFRGGISDAWVVATNNGGVLLWSTCLGGNGADFIRCLKNTPNGNFVALVQTASSDAPGYHLTTDGFANHFDVLKCRLNSSGNIQTEKCYGSVANEIPYDLIVLNDSIDIFAAKIERDGADVSGSHDADAFSKDIWLCETKRDSIVLWKKSLGGSLDEQPLVWVGRPVNGMIAQSTERLSAGNDLVLMAISRSRDGDVKRNLPSSSFNDYNLWIVIVDSAGLVKNQQNLGGLRNEWIGASLVKTGNNSYLAIGSSESINNNRPSTSNQADIWLIQFRGDNYVTGKVYIDYNNNQVQDSNEPLADNIRMEYQKFGYKQYGLTQQGRYQQALDSGRYQFKAYPPNPYFTVNPVSVNDTFQVYFRTDTINYALLPVPGKRDIGVVTAQLKELRPDSNVVYRIHYFNMGTDTVPSGTVVFKKDSRFSFVSSVPATSAVSGDSLKWNYSNLKPLDTASIYLKLKIPASPTVNANDLIKQKALILPITGDLKPIDNTDSLYQIVASVDTAFEKHENHGAFFLQSYIGAGGYLNYSFHFRNRGVSTISNLTFTDTLPAEVDSSSLQLIGASHPYTLTVTNGRILQFEFKNIQLPIYVPTATTNNICYLCFRVKPLSSLTSGTVIRNAAQVSYDNSDPENSNDVNTGIQ